MRGLEDSDVPVTDDVYDDLKQRRARLKDELYQMLTANQSP
ncbi:YdcH family protein [Endozoicomonas sp. SCSIO W0465]|nr:YdcH family protein [Endozoicomonas sp. SCSIO W0465]USE36281.1 YdcH family protein [Endozoicomonas sp. SCSIO W0465]